MMSQYLVVDEIKKVLLENFECLKTRQNLITPVLLMLSAYLSKYDTTYLLIIGVLCAAAYWYYTNKFTKSAVATPAGVSYTFKDNKIGGASVVSELALQYLLSKGEWFPEGLSVIYYKKTYRLSAGTGHSKFIDPIHNVSGFVYSIYDCGEKKDETYTTVLTLTKKGTYKDVSSYLEDLYEYRQECNKKQNKHLYFQKPSRYYTWKNEPFTNEKIPIDNSKKIFKSLRDSFFSKHKDMIFDSVEYIMQPYEDIMQKGLNMSCQLLLHGPPGTGKSSIIYRLANYFGLNICIFNICNNTRSTVENTFSPNLYINDVNNRKYIIVLDEFDETIKQLKQNEIEYEKLKEGKGATNKDKVKEIKQSIRLKELLTFFQGPVPAVGRIIIATTNNIDYIREEIPALLRPGRLTPVHFDYMDRVEFEELYRYYFKSPCEVKFNKLNIPTSEVIEQITVFNNDKEKFDKWLEGKINVS